jgi:hypothetical protein
LPVFCREVEAHVAQSGEPETFPGIYTADLRKEEPFIKLLEIAVDPRKRPQGDRAPCPMCHSPNKFTKGWLVYLERLQAVAVIGTECASHDTRTSADKEWRDRAAQLKEEEYLEATIPQLPQWLAVVAKAAPAAEAATTLLKGFRSKGKLFFKLLAPAKAPHGRLVVSEVIAARSEGPRGMRTSGSNVDTRDIPVGTIRGLKALDTRFTPTRELDSVRDLILPHVCDGEEALVNYITGSPLQRKRAYQELRKAEQALRSFLADLRDCRLFFSEDNLAVIAEWAEHPLAARPFKVGIYPIADGRRVLFHGSGELWNQPVASVLWDPLPSFGDGPSAMAA